jgi:hypothetical protein
MKKHREALRKTAQDFQKKHQKADDPELFKMKKFSNVESRIKQNLKTQNSKDDLRPVVERRNSAAKGS